MGSYVFLPPPPFQIKNKIKEWMEASVINVSLDMDGGRDAMGDKAGDGEVQRDRQRVSQRQKQKERETKGKNANGMATRVGSISRSSDEHDYYHHQHHLHQQQQKEQSKQLKQLKQSKAPANANKPEAQPTQQPNPVPATQQQTAWRSERSLIIRKTIAGAFAEAFSVILLYPLDTIKLYRQSCATTSKSLARSPQSWPNVSKLYAGLPQSVFGAAASAAIFALIYHISKRAFRRRFSTPNFTFISRIFAGVSATAVSALIDSPVLFVRNQLRLGTHGTNIKEVLHYAVESNGVRGLYTGFRSQLLNNLPFDTLELATYEHLRRMFKPGFLCWGKGAGSPSNAMNAFVPNPIPSPSPIHGSSPNSSLNRNADPKIATHNSVSLPKTNNSMFTSENLEYLLLGMLTGAMVGAITNPLDVLRSRIITRPARYHGIRYSARLIWRREGMRGFAAGLGPKVAHETLNSGVFFLLYEMAYNVMERWQDTCSRKNLNANVKAASVSM